MIYELDTPIVSARVSSDSLACNATQTLSSLFTAIDPANKAITQWQAYDTATGDMLVLGGVDYQDHSAASALTATSLSALSLLAGSAATSDTLEVRAFNGTYWGDWTSLAVAVVASSSNVASPPVLSVSDRGPDLAGWESCFIGAARRHIHRPARAEPDLSRGLGERTGAAGLAPFQCGDGYVSAGPRPPRRRRSTSW